MQGIWARAFYAAGDTLTPAVAGSVVMVLIIPIYWSLSRLFGVVGLVLASDLGILMHTAALLILLPRRLDTSRRGEVVGGMLRAYAVGALAALPAWARRATVAPRAAARSLTRLGAARGRRAGLLRGGDAGRAPARRRRSLRLLRRRLAASSPGATLMSMTASHREQLRSELIDRLTVIYQSVRANLSAHTIDKAMRPDPSDEAEESAIDELRALDADLGERERLLAHSIEDALRRMNSEDYGICIDCEREIAFERLRSVPWTLRCADDEERAERGSTHPTL